mmetsp:Transcript_50973/g.118425  ORF Transcript_50973/g.118425 Transcript_50973/m.118425 type:complete len:212 (-) Transcript_50973:855-1490(-)
MQEDCAKGRPRRHSLATLQIAQWTVYGLTGAVGPLAQGLAAMVHPGGSVRPNDRAAVVVKLALASRRRRSCAAPVAARCLAAGASGAIGHSAVRLVGRASAPGHELHCRRPRMVELNVQGKGLCKRTATGRLARWIAVGNLGAIGTCALSPAGVVPTTTECAQSKLKPTAESLAVVRATRPQPADRFHVVGQRLQRHLRPRQQNQLRRHQQ